MDVPGHPAATTMPIDWDDNAAGVEFHKVWSKQHKTKHGYIWRLKKLVVEEQNVTEVWLRDEEPNEPKAGPKTDERKEAIEASMTQSVLAETGSGEPATSGIQGQLIPMSQSGQTTIPSSQNPVNDIRQPKQDSSGY